MIVTLHKKGQAIMTLQIVSSSEMTPPNQIHGYQCTYELNIPPKLQLQAVHPS